MVDSYYYCTHAIPTMTSHGKKRHFSSFAVMGLTIDGSHATRLPSFEKIYLFFIVGSE